MKEEKEKFMSILFLFRKRWNNSSEDDDVNESSDESTKSSHENFQWFNLKLNFDSEQTKKLLKNYLNVETGNLRQEVDNNGITLMFLFTSTRLFIFTSNRHRSMSDAFCSLSFTLH